MFKDKTSSEKTDTVVGTRQWFSVSLESKTATHVQQSSNDSDSSDLSPEQIAHVSYNMVQQDVKVGFIYIRKQYDQQIDVCFKTMTSVFRAALEAYLQNIQKKVMAGEAKNLSLFTTMKIFPQKHGNLVEEDLACIFDDAETK